MNGPPKWSAPDNTSEAATLALTLGNADLGLTGHDDSISCPCRARRFVFWACWRTVDAAGSKSKGQCGQDSKSGHFRVFLQRAACLRTSEGAVPP